jgi:hypothetical protein
MTTIMAPAGLVNLEAPLPSPRQYDLLAAATLVEPTDNRWLGGAWIGGDVPGPAYTHDPCSTGTDRVKAGPGEIPQAMTGRFVVYMPGFCTAQSIGPDPSFFTDRLNLIFRVYEGAAVERVLANGDGHATLGPYLGDSNMKNLSVAAVTSLRALELLETDIGPRGSGIIHAAPATVTAWESQNLLENFRGVKRTKATSTPVAVGPGYIGVHPDGTGAPASDQEWAFASGPLEIRRAATPETFPGNYSEAVDRAFNDVLFFAERPYLLNWIARQDSLDDDHIQAGVLIDLVP